jgi:hypothetical protein
MNEEEKEFVDHIRSVYRAPEMSSSEAVRFDEALTKRRSVRPSMPRGLVLAGAVGALALLLWTWTPDGPDMQPDGLVAQSEAPLGDPKLEAPEDEFGDESAWGFEVLFDDEEDLADDAEWMPDDYLALATLIDFHQKEELIP